MTIFESLTTDLDWRESELGSLRILLSRNDISKKQKEVLLRAAWAMLYAHYEGFSKFCLTVFYDEASKRMSDCEALPPRTKALALDKQLKRLKSLPSLEMLYEMEAITDQVKALKPDFPEVDTKSNLWPSVMNDLLLDADIIIDALSLHSAKLKTLVARRNGIAHGQKNFIDEVDYYFTYENAVYDVLYHLAYSVDDRLTKAPYGD
ncbi:MAE_28990/MAE_18760 family HEPN-like nuclease [Tritonibacter mobilis]|nr:MAE_28990/MAE_18760 family HEPN-like nuclease [Tritonibacter mobilis]